MSIRERHDLNPIHRREAQSGTVSYGDPVILHETTVSRQVLIPFFIPRSSGTELAVKLITYRKAKPPMDWVTVEEKSISLSGQAARELLRGLKEHLAVAQEDDNGEYIAIRVSDGAAKVADLDPGVVAKAVIGLLSRDDIARHLTTRELGSEFISAFRVSVRIQELRLAVAELRQHLDAGVVDEQVYQRWCENHSWSFGNAYVMRDDVRQVTPGDKLDVLLPTVIAGYRDVVELKRPSMEVLVYDTSHRNYYFSAEVSKAIGQCHRYLDVLAEEAAKGLRDHPEIVAYHPRAIIVIGRSAGWDDDKLRALHGLNSRLHGLSVMTYDQLLAQGERLVELVAQAPDEDEPEMQMLECDDII